MGQPGVRPAAFEIAAADVSSLSATANSVALITLDIEALAKILWRSPASIRSDLCRNPQSLPPRLNLGGKKPLWLPSAVLAWLESRVATPPQPQVVLPEPAPKRGRGRPTKAEQIARQRASMTGGGK